MQEQARHSAAHQEQHGRLLKKAAPPADDSANGATMN
jgi:hypothetical protein